MTADVEQYDLLVCDLYGKCDPETVSKADGLDAFISAPKVVIFEMWLKGVMFQIAQNACDFVPQFRMLFPKLFGSVSEMG